jgi:decaprenylphospho-beta-D-erythro-pentofuranosid-2-ulose 2-reductase
MDKVLIVGATSAIAEATARLFAEAGDRLFLIGRREPRLAAMAADLESRGAAKVDWHVLDLNQLDEHESAVAEAEARMGGIDIVLIAHGTLPDQSACQASAESAVEAFGINAVSTIALLTRLAQVMERQKHGTIGVITSVAAERGRQSNYLYGSAKAAVDTFLEGLRQRLYKVGVHVTAIRPGFIDTPMTASFEKGLLWARPEQVAAPIHRALVSGADVVYVPAFWRFAMILVRSMPRSIFKRLTL